MFEELKSESLKEITAQKKKLNWGEVPAIYYMASSSLGDLEGILTHGFESAYKTILNKTTWNLSYLDGYRDKDGVIFVNKKPKIMLRHVYTENNYELHCYPIVHGEPVNTIVQNNQYCPFEAWIPEVSQRLFRVSSLTAFIIYTFQSGDKADLKLIKYSHVKIQELINTLSESFEIVKVKGYNIVEFCNYVSRRKGNLHIDELLGDDANLDAKNEANLDDENDEENDADNEVNN